VRRTRWWVVGALAAAMVTVPAAPASAALGDPVDGSFVCETTLVGAGGFAGTTINAAPVQLESTITLPGSGTSPVNASVTVSPVGAGSMPVSPPLDLVGVTVTQVGARLDVYRSPTNSATAITGPVDMATGTTAVLGAPGTQFASTPWAVPGGFTVTGIPVTGAAGDRVWVRLKSLTYTFSATGYTGSTLCRLAGASAGGSSTVVDPIYGSLSDFSAQYPESATDLDLGLGETALRAELGNRVTITGTVAPPPSSSCTVTDPSGCTTGQQITATVTAGTLSQQADAAGSNPSSTAIVLTEQDAGDKYTYAGTPAVTTATVAQVMEGALNPVTVTDVRGGTAGWSLTAELSGPFTEVGTGVMPESAAKLVQVGCAPLAGSATRTTGTGGTLSNAVTLCGVDPGVDDSDGQSGGGQYEVTGAVELTVPAFQKAGEYSATLVITLT
jgi:hypothetical protein